MTNNGTVTTDATTQKARPGADGVVPVIRPVDASAAYEGTPDDYADYPDDDESGNNYNTPIPGEKLTARPVGSLAFLGLAALGIGGLIWYANRKKRRKSRSRR